MKNSLFVRRNSLAALLLAASCASPKEEAVAPNATPQTQDALPDLFWSPGTLQPGVIVPVTELRNLPGGLTGAPIWKSNNPEAITGEGWLMTNGANALQRGGRVAPITGPIALYLSHLNFTGQQANTGVMTRKRPLYLHIMASNRNSRTITITGKGKIVANNKWRYVKTNPLSVKSAWYLASEAWINNTLDNINKTVMPNTAVTIAKVLLPAPPDGEPAFATEARYELNVTGGGAFFSTVTTNVGTEFDMRDKAIQFISGIDGQQATGNAESPIITPTPDNGTAYGREAGIASHSEWFTGDVSLTLPATAPGYMALCYNTNARKPALLNNPNVFYQDQTALHTMRLRSSSRTWGGYGHKYNAKLVLRNPSPTQKNVRISLGANPINAAVSGGSQDVVFDAPVQTLVNGAAGQVHQVVLFNNQYAPNPRGKQRQALRTVPVPGNGTVTVNVICYVPGLGFGAGQQLVIESGI